MSFALRGVSKCIPLAKQSVQQKATIVSGPPRNIVGWPEKLTLGGIMIFGTVAPAAYILSNLQEYKKREGD